ncbi:HlyD family type I secretion periplasmic adaptor subunit [Camelimonas sp. ID_303_24]
MITRALGLQSASPPGVSGPEPDHVLDHDATDVRLTRATRVIWVAVGLAAAFLVWASVAVLDEVASGQGKVAPSSREQVIQSLEGGILSALNVRQDDVVTPGQILAQLDPTRTEANVGEAAARLRAAQASAARLTAEVNMTELDFPAALNAWPELVQSETRLYNARRKALDESSRWLRHAMDLVRKELAISENLQKVGAASHIDVIRLNRQMVDMELKLADLQSQYIVRAREELARANADVEALQSQIRGRTDSLSRLVFRSPVRGVVKNIEVTTLGGVIPPNGKLMEIVPLDDQLLIEARISPRDIAFIHEGQRAVVKISAYDYAIYGGLEGAVSSISPDTIRDEVRADQFYYRVFIKTKTDALTNSVGKRFPIFPGMIATADIHTGEKTVLQYLLRPLNRAREAMRER